MEREEPIKVRIWQCIGCGVIYQLMSDADPCHRLEGLDVFECGDLMCIAGHPTADEAIACAPPCGRCGHIRTRHLDVLGGKCARVSEPPYTKFTQCECKAFVPTKGGAE